MTLSYSLKDSGDSFPEWKALRCGGFGLIPNLPFSTDCVRVVSHAGASEHSTLTTGAELRCRTPSPIIKYPFSCNKGVTEEHEQRRL